MYGVVKNQGKFNIVSYIQLVHNREGQWMEKNENQLNYTRKRVFKKKILTRKKKNSLYKSECPNKPPLAAPHVVNPTY